MNEPTQNDDMPAFPNKDELGNIIPGMSLRDYFAAHASEQDIESHIGGDIHPKSGGLMNCRTREAAKYHYADAMLKARDAK